jgi:hypothetical protein
VRQIRSFNVLQTAKVMGALYFVLGVAVSLFIAGRISIARRAPGHGGLLIAVLAPFIYGVLGFVFSAIVCWLYNVIAGLLGGIEVEVVASE